MKSAKKRIKKGAAKAVIGSSVIAASQILASFGNTAMADCGGYGGNVCLTITPQDFCVTDNTATTVNLGNYTPHPYVGDLVDPDTEGYYITSATVSSGANQVAPFDTFTTTPASNAYNGYPAGPPTPMSTFNYDFSFTSPDVPANTGPISLGNGRREYVIDLYAEAREWNGSSYVITNGLVTEPDEFITVTVDHKNTAPTIANPTQPETIYVPSGTTTISFDVSVDISDVESNTADITFQLSDNSLFTNIIQAHTYSGESLSSTPATFEHSWTDVPVDDYYWRAIATETDAIGTCAGFTNSQLGNNFTVQASSTFFESADAPTPTPAVLPETGIVSDAIGIIDLGFLFLISGLVGMMFTVYHAVTKYDKLFKRTKSEQ